MVFADSKSAVIILAAGLGTRMRSKKAKVLHEILGRPMISYVVETAIEVAGNDVIVVIGNQAEKVRKILSREGRLKFAYQHKQLGTGHAVLCALPYLPVHCENVVILNGDVPLVRADTIFRLIQNHLKHRRDITVLAVVLNNPTGYGRILTDKTGQVLGIIEDVDATDAQKNINTINTGIYCVNRNVLSDSLQNITANNTQGELYLTDIVAIGYNANKKIGLFIGPDASEFYGINDRRDLRRVETLMQGRQINRA